MHDHGRFELSTEYNVLFFNGFGTWNADTTQVFCSAFKHQAKNLAGQPWAMVANLNEWQLGTPDTEPLFQQLAKWAIANGLLVVVGIYADSAVKTFQLNNISRVLNSNYVQRYFTNEHDAFNWLKTQGYQINDSRFAPPNG